MDHTTRRWALGTVNPVRARMLAYVLVAATAYAPSAWASEAGGLPALAAQVDALQSLVTTLQGAVAALQSTNATLKSALDAEVAARAAAEAALQTALAQETSARVAGDTALQTALTAEAVDRAKADQHLEDLVTGSGAGGPPEVFAGRGGVSPRMDNTTPTEVASLQVPAGNYLIHAIVPLFNFDEDSQQGRCALSTASNPFGNVLPTGAIGYLDIEGSTNARISLVATAAFAQPTAITVRCIGFNWVAINAAIEAVTVNALH